MCKRSFLLIATLLPLPIVLGNLQFMKHLFAKCSKKLRKHHENHENTEIFVKSVPLNNFKFTNEDLELNWKLPIVQSELAENLKSIQIVLTTKSYNSVSIPNIALSHNNTTIKTFQLPRSPQFVRINMKNTIELLSDYPSKVLLRRFISLPESRL